MAILNISINTDDIFSDYDNDGVSFESLLTSTLREEIKKDIFDRIAKSKIATETEKIRVQTEQAIEDKLNNLINEDLALTDKWGKVTFVGIIEDYIKKQIDDRLTAPVDSQGKVPSGCSSRDNVTWIQWVVKNKISHQLQVIEATVVKQASAYCENTLKEEINKFTQCTLKGLIVQQLESIGIFNKDA